MRAGRTPSAEPLGRSTTNRRRRRLSAMRAARFVERVSGQGPRSAGVRARDYVQGCAGHRWLVSIAHAGWPEASRIPANRVSPLAASSVSVSCAAQTPRPGAEFRDDGRSNSSRRSGRAFFYNEGAVANRQRRRRGMGVRAQGIRLTGFESVEGVKQFARAFRSSANSVNANRATQAFQNVDNVTDRWCK